MTSRSLILTPAIALAAFLALAGAAFASSQIEDKYKALGGAHGSLGKPTSPETATPDGVGRYRHYEHGSIYWSPHTAASEVSGLIEGKWAGLGWEKSYLGYPMTDEMDTYDRAGRVSKFQGGELIWRRATNAVSAVKSSDLVIDLPTPVGEPWYIIQANGVLASDSHGGAWAYCWDLDWNDQQPATKGRVFVAGADGRIVYVDQAGDKNLPALANVISQRLGQGRYLSYMHLRQGSWDEHGGRAGTLLQPQALPWDERPVKKSGDPMAETGAVGAPKNAYHIHYCVTTAPDRPQFMPFESVPVAFRNYSVSVNGGANWSYVDVGVPRQGQMIRRERERPGAKDAPQVNTASTPLNFGAVQGQIRVKGPGEPKTGGKLHVAVTSAWGEPLAQITIDLTSANPRGPWSFNFPEVADYAGSNVTVTYQGGWTTPADVVGGQSANFAVPASGAAKAEVAISATKYPPIK